MKCSPQGLIKRFQSGVFSGLPLLWFALFLNLSGFGAITPPDFQRDILPVLQEFCFDCHGDGSKKGGVSLEPKASTGMAPKGDDAEFPLWLSVWKNLDGSLMPPADKPKPSEEQTKALKHWIERSVFKLDPEKPDPGRVTIRRLNRSEYRNTVRDLTGIDFAVLDQFPTDDSGYGFDTIGDVLSVSPLLLEKYLEAAQSIVETSLRSPTPNNLQRLIPYGPHPKIADQREALAKWTIERFAERSFRRPVEAQILDRLLAIFRQAETEPNPSFENSLSHAFTAILSSPRFLFRTELQPQPDDPSKIQPLDEFALASRLSYFLWNTLPDEELRSLAAKGELRNKLRQQVDRMIQDWRFPQFVSSFVGQWLQTRDVETTPVQPPAILKNRDFDASYKVFSGPVRQAMRMETELLFQHLVRENLPALELLTAQYTFLNESLAKFYEIPDVKGKDMRKVELPPESSRGGILTHGSFLVVTSNPTRTSPVKRGQFVLENLLGTPPPPPPPNIPPLETAGNNKGHSLSMRELMELHRSKPLCASCHARMDPIGLALEEFNALGMIQKNSTSDTSGKLITGETFANTRELSQVLAASRRHDFYTCITEKLLIYALGRGMEYYDLPTIEKIVATLEQGPGPFREIIYSIVESVPFQMRRGNSQKLSKSF